MLADTFGRTHDCLRISVTDRCNLRCTYCMPEEVTFRDRSELLTFEEIERFTAAVIPLGISKLRLTGGEPLMRRGLPELVARLQLPGIRDIGLTTNGLLLAQQAVALKQAGLERLNVSLDTLDAERFRTLTRREGLDDVLAGLEATKSAGFRNVKVNAVAIRGMIDADAVPLARYCRENGFTLRFIEYMPIGAEAWEREKFVPAHELLEWLEAEFGPIVPAPDYDPRAPAMDFIYSDGGGRLGMIASVSRPFCKMCNRLRITADGKLRNCLFAHDEADVRTLMRDGCEDEAIREMVRANVWAKGEGHEIHSAKFLKPLRTMHAIGG